MALICTHIFPDGTRCTLSEEVHQIPGMSHRRRERTCFECEHLALTGQGASLCTVFEEQILSESQAASDCMAYEEAS